RVPPGPLPACPAGERVWVASSTLATLLRPLPARPAGEEVWEAVRGTPLALPQPCKLLHLPDEPARVQQPIPFRDAGDGLHPIRSTGLLQPFADQLGEVLHRQCAVGQQRFVVAAQVELLAHLALYLLPQSVERHPADEVGR